MVGTQVGGMVVSETTRWLEPTAARSPAGSGSLVVSGAVEYDAEGQGSDTERDA
jgi:hypothetical protein